jgi:hypothetical protein
MRRCGRVVVLMPADALAAKSFAVKLPRVSNESVPFGLEDAMRASGGVYWNDEPRPEDVVELTAAMIEAAAPDPETIMLPVAKGEALLLLRVLNEALPAVQSKLTPDERMAAWTFTARMLDTFKRAQSQG